jgi:hypothetical protein
MIVNTIQQFRVVYESLQKVEEKITKKFEKNRREKYKKIIEKIYQISTNIDICILALENFARDFNLKLSKQIEENVKTDIIKLYDYCDYNSVYIKKNMDKALIVSRRLQKILDPEYSEPDYTKIALELQKEEILNYPK